MANIKNLTFCFHQVLLRQAVWWTAQGTQGCQHRAGWAEGAARRLKAGGRQAQ